MTIVLINKVDRRNSPLSPLFSISPLSLKIWLAHRSPPHLLPQTQIKKYTLNIVSLSSSPNRIVKTISNVKRAQTQTANRKIPCECVSRSGV